jgi:hypothetical protein
MSLRRWDEKKIAKLKKYWLIKTNTEIGNMLGISAVSVGKKARDIGLADKRKMHRGTDGAWHNPKYTPEPGEIEQYGPRYDTIKEIEGRRKTAMLKHVKKNFKKGDKIKLINYESDNSATLKYGKRYLTPKKKSGEITDITNCLIVVRRKHYNECFRFADILSGRTVVEGLNVCQ